MKIKFSGENSFFGEKIVFGHYRHNCHYFHYPFVERLRDFFLVDTLHDFLLRGCMILCVEVA